MLKIAATINKVSDSIYTITPSSSLDENVKYFIHIGEGIHSQDSLLDTNLPNEYEFNTVSTVYYLSPMIPSIYLTP